MLSESKKQTIYDKFKQLSTWQRQVIALRIICYEFRDERRLIATIKESGLVDDQNRPFSEKIYKELVVLLNQIGCIEHSTRLSILPELHHDLLVLMPEKDMPWVCATTGELYKNRSVYYYADAPGKEKTGLMISIYLNQPDLFIKAPEKIGYCNWLVVLLGEIFASSPIQLEWLASRHPLIREYICIALLSSYYSETEPAKNSKDVFALFAKHLHENNRHDYLNYYGAIIYLSTGNIDAAQTCYSRIEDDKSGYGLALQATFAFLNMEFDTASKLYRKALTALRKQAESTNYYFDNILGLFYSFCTLCVNKNYKQLTTHANHYHKYYDAYWAMKMDRAYWMFPAMALVESGDLETAKQELSRISTNSDRFKHPLVLALYHLASYMLNQSYLEQNQQSIYQQLHQSIEHQQHLAAHLLYELLAKTKSHQAEADAFLDGSSLKLRLFSLIRVKETWEYSFQALEGLLINETALAGGGVHTKRLMWLVDPDKQEVSVVEQSLNKSGQWSHGRALSLNKLRQHAQDPHFDYLSTQDKQVIAGIQNEDDNWYYHQYQLSPYHCFLALVGHPCIAHLQNRDISIELVKGEPELYIEENKHGFHLSLSHFLPAPGLIIEPESLNKYRVIDYSTAFAGIGQIITKNGLTVPANAKDKLLNIIQHANRDIKIHAGIKDCDIPEVAGDAAPCVQLLPLKDGVRATLWVKPLSDHGTYFKAAQGKDSFMAIVSDQGIEKRTRVQRHFKNEQKNQKALLAQCSSLSQHEYDTGEYEIESPEDVLEVLSELQQFADKHPLNIEWPQGQTFKIKQRVDGRNLSLKISSEQNWFEFDGKITLNDGEVVYMQELLQSLNGQSHGRFIRLGNGEFIELTSQLKKQLALLHALADDNKINPLGAQALSDIAAQAEQTTFDDGWTAHLKKVKTMSHYTATVPSTLQATLRDYQIEGFQHLSRLTHWGIGACLADDMGLGKTVQTIALLLERAKQGASLVVAPTSVCFNWMDELLKFAPTLNAYDLRRDDRTHLINNAGKFDVIICSYGLLQHNGELLTDKTWGTIVLDEAQAIKNAQTQRWKTVMQLKSKGRIALSGTPIENHLGELWSIFSFINPALLGSVKHFQDKFSMPIETRQSPERTHALKALVQPYMIRRLKSEVLKELPPKTEQTIHVEPTEQETAFYEALRRTAEERMSDLIADNNRIGVLAEITKLRQACCDSSLIDSAVSLENSKLKVFSETVKNIIDNGHKVLVFSQFVSFLEVIRQRIEAEGIAYQYIDGSTSAPKRKKAVEAFQSGEGDVFLLSLKAGGSGLNLTAADYVIHMDPWWNPAVEDQASDRAHRIGQERPVTIYRLVMRNTIEEKIIALHEHKRNLANDLLSGQEVSGKLSNEDLMNLIRAPFL